MPAWLAVNAQVPTPTMVKVLPDTVQMVLALLVENVNAVRPLLAVALKVMGDIPKFTGDEGANVTVWLAALITTLALADALL